MAAKDKNLNVMDKEVKKVSVSSSTAAPVKKFYKMSAPGAHGRHLPKNAVTNAQFAKTDMTFLQSCENANVSPTPRQASKFRRGKGLAHKLGR